MFSKNIRILYLYVISFLALMAIIAGTINLVEKITNYIYPVEYFYDYSDIEAYPQKSDAIYQTTSTDITVQKQNAQIRTLREIFTSIAVILVSVPLYSYHWKMIQRERKREEV